MTANIGAQTVNTGGPYLVGTYTFTGALTTNAVVVQTVDLINGLIFTADVNASDSVRVYAYNFTGLAVVIPGGGQDVYLSLLKEAGAHDVTFNTVLDYAVFEKVGSKEVCAQRLASCIGNNPKFRGKVSAWNSGDTLVTLVSEFPGATGNDIEITLSHTRSLSGYPEESDIHAVSIVDDIHMTYPTMGTCQGGIDIPANAGSGTTQLELTGMTERFPMGALLQDSDFLCEDPLRDTVSAMKSSPSGPRPLQTSVPLTNGGDEYTRFWGESGEVVSLSDGSISVLSYGAWTEATPTGTKMFRLYRGGGPLFLLSGETPGGPLDWVSDTFPPALQPVLKGGILACRAMLVRNFHEEVNSGNGPYKVSDGDEIQMVIATYGLIGHGAETTDGYSMNGIIGPAGYGEGYAAADRFRLSGKPMFRGFGEGALDPTAVQIAVYPDEQR